MDETHLAGMFRRKTKQDGISPSGTDNSIGRFHRYGQYCGVATALTLGGPGAIFWMWISALLGMMTIYAETVLGMKYRKR